MDYQKNNIPFFIGVRILPHCARIRTWAKIMTRCVKSGQDLPNLEFDTHLGQENNYRMHISKAWKEHVHTFYVLCTVSNFARLKNIVKTILQ